MDHNGSMNIRLLDDSDAAAASVVVNAAAAWYAEIVPGYSGVEMDPAEWIAEGRRLAWYGAFDDGVLVGVMGLEYVDDVALFRHAYVLPSHQRSGVGSMLQQKLMADLRPVSRVLIGTYAANYKARRLLARTGFVLVADSQAELRRYWNIPDDRLSTSVVYEMAISDATTG